ncbi:hypothetical protein GCM10025863_16750 [Microbacterium suwonense]|uniref:Uncharacterized protein n=1 Tax=Microbacterium suwonense TaxID=683047 RepID=A0ABM8FU27_9MICO|nr:hypothetical protein GCM10025863_16750 [Microbacterium suwonense]
MDRGGADALITAAQTLPKMMSEAAAVPTAAASPPLSRPDRKLLPEVSDPVLLRCDTPGIDPLRNRPLASRFGRALREETADPSIHYAGARNFFA